MARQNRSLSSISTSCRDRRHHAGRFHDVSGFDSTIDVIEHREGGENIDDAQAARADKYSNIVLSGASPTRELYDWYRDVDQGQDPAARNGCIVLSIVDGVREECAGTSSTPGRRSGTGPTSTPRATTSRSRRWSSPTKGSRGRRPCSRPSSSSRLPFGYLDDDGTLHRDGVMRLATAADEILPLKDPRVQQPGLSDRDPAVARGHAARQRGA